MPVILISPDSEVGVVLEATKLGPVDFLKRPVNPAILLPKVYEALHRMRHIAPHKSRNARFVAV